MGYTYPKSIVQAVHYPVPPCLVISSAKLKLSIVSIELAKETPSVCNFIIDVGRVLKFVFM